MRILGVGGCFLASVCDENGISRMQTNQEPTRKDNQPLCREKISKNSTSPNQAGKWDTNWCLFFFSNHSVRVSLHAPWLLMCVEGNSARKSLSDHPAWRIRVSFWGAQGKKWKKSAYSQTLLWVFLDIVAAKVIICLKRWRLSLKQPWETCYAHKRDDFAGPKTGQIGLKT